MLDMGEDMSTVFYGGDFAATFMRHRPATAPKEVAGILGIADEDALDGKALTVARTLRMPSGCDVRADDILEVVTGMPSLGVLEGARFKVLDKPVRVNDGSEMEALLGSVPA
jgi:hypothetical protein